MEIHVFKTGASAWGFDISAANGTVLASAHRAYASRRNAVSAAELIAGGKLKVVVSE